MTTVTDISHGVFPTMFKERNRRLPATTPTYVLQVIGIKSVNKRSRLILSDGVNHINGMLTSQNSDMEEQLSVNDLVRLHEYMINELNGRSVMILLNIELVGKVDHRIGNPDSQFNKALINSTNQAQGGTASPTKSLYGNSYGGNAAAAPPASSYGGSNSVSNNSSSSNNPYMGGGTSTPAALSAPIVRSNPGSNATPIAALSMYNNRFTLQVNCTAKSDVRVWSNNKGEGSLFSVDLLDQSSDIRATFFKEAVEKYYNLLHVGKTYRITGGRLKVANKQWNTCRSNFELTYDTNTEIHQVEDDPSIQQQYDFKKIADLESIEPNTFVDVLAVVKSVGDVANIVSKKSGNELTKCDLILADDSGTEVSMTLWGRQANSAAADYGGQPVVAIRKARVSDYNGKTLGSPNGVVVNPPMGQQLASWWQAQGSSMAAKSLSTNGTGGRMDAWSDRLSIRAITDQHMGQSPDKADFLSFKAVISYVKTSKEGGAWYPACPNAGEPCKNRFKVTQTTDGQWFCDKCQQQYPAPVRRWIFSGVVEDGTSSTWVSFFNEQAETLLGATADATYAAAYGMDGGFDQDAYDSAFASSLYSEWVFKCKVKTEFHNDENRVKTSVYNLAPVDFLQESKELLTALE